MRSLTRGCDADFVDAVGARWYQHTHERQDLISIGTTRLTFTIDRSGKVNNLKVIENTANEAFAIVCLQSVQELKLPPMRKLAG